MKRPITAILIDPFTCKVSPVALDRDDLQTYYRALSHETMPVHLFEVARPRGLAAGDALFFDEEGKFKIAERWFIFPGLFEPIAGKGLIVGADRRGNSANVETNPHSIARVVHYLERLPGLPGFHETRDPWQPPQAS